MSETLFCRIPALDSEIESRARLQARQKMDSIWGGDWAARGVLMELEAMVHQPVVSPPRLATLNVA